MSVTAHELELEKARKEGYAAGQAVTRNEASNNAGYQPGGEGLDTSNPPKGGSGVPKTPLDMTVKVEVAELIPTVITALQCIVAQLIEINKKFDSLGDRSSIPRYAGETQLQHDKKRVMQLLADNERVLMSRRDAEWLVGYALLHDEISEGKARELLDCGDTGVVLVKDLVKMIKLNEKEEAAFRL